MPQHPEVIDSDVDLHDAAQRTEMRFRSWDLLAAVALGGVAGAEARYGVGEAIPFRGGGFPWSTLIINASGCFLIGLLMVLVLELTDPHRLLRPFLGVGVLGGYTTYSTFAVEVQRLVTAHRAGTALVYVVLTVTCCLVAVFAATVLARAAGRVALDSGLRAREMEKRR